ncbi:MAG: xylan 1,4-beta-xylosidase [Clostridiales bacterium]|jgi:hypothetical protein|nr:xylan 1,4-beta-xylosidase [Clostridiales bacterium]
MKKRNKNNRFVVVSEESTGFGRGFTILLDRETGVNYLYYQSGYGGGLTPLLDNQGRPVVTTVHSDFQQY